MGLQDQFIRRMCHHGFQKTACDAILFFGRLPGLGRAGKENGEGLTPAMRPALLRVTGFQIYFRSVRFNIDESPPVPSPCQPGIVPDVTADPAGRPSEPATDIGIDGMRTNRFQITAGASEDGLALNFSDFHRVLPLHGICPRAQGTRFTPGYPLATTGPISTRKCFDQIRMLSGKTLHNRPFGYPPRR